MKNNKFVFIVVAALVMMLVPAAVSADAGPKPSITIRAVNMPDSECYMDLLVKSGYDGFENEELLTDEYNRDMVGILREYNDGGWRPGVANGLFMTFDDIKCEIEDGSCLKTFGYMPPDEFKIIVVDKAGNVTVSNAVERKMFDSTIDFDYETGEASERGMFPGILLQFLLTFLITFAVEAVIFIAFRFSFRKYWGLLTAVNLGTQLLLHAVIGLGMLAGGIFIALIFYVAAEFLVFVIEGFVYGLTLKQHPVGRRIGYALTANVISAVIGFILAIILALA